MRDRYVVYLSLISFKSITMTKKRERLIKKMQTAKEIHESYVLLQSNPETKLDNVGGVLWHKRWVKTYIEVIKELKK